MKNKLLSILLLITTTVFIISLSIFLPLANRRFYYGQIDKLHIVDDLNTFTGKDYTKEDVIEAFDDVMDFIWKGTEFKTGKLKYSEDGKSHFEDCVPLFKLDLIVMIVSSAILVTLLVLYLLKLWNVYDYFGYSPLFYGGILSLLLVMIIGVFGIINFNKLFDVFHKIFFPGKSNWQFDPTRDEVIMILPQDFFMNCAILMGAGLLTLSILSIVYGILKRYKFHKLI